MKIKSILPALALFMYFSSQLNGQWTTSNGLNGMNISDIEVYDSIIYLCSGSEGVYYKHIEGDEWLNSIPHESIKNIESTDSVLFGIGNYYLMRSFNKGVSWEIFGNELNLIFSLCTIGNTLFVSSFDSIYMSTDEGNTWFSMEVDLSGFSGFETSSYDSSLFCYDYYHDSMLMTRNLGESWSFLNKTGLPETMPNNLYDIIVHNDSIWAATREGVYVFIDNNVGWVSRNEGLIDETVIKDLDIFNSIYYCVGEEGIFYYDNYVWTAVNNGLETLDVNRITHFNNMQFCGTDWGPLQKHQNEDWLTIYFNLNHLEINDIGCYEDNVFVCTGKGLFKSENKGRDFQYLVFEEFSDCNKIIITDSLFYLNSIGSGLFISRDLGDSWIKISGNLKGRRMALGSDFIYLDEIGINRADHINYNWEPLTDWVATANVWEIAAKDTIVLCGVYGDSTYISFDNGETFSGTLSSLSDEIIVSSEKFYAIHPYYSLKTSVDGLSWSEYPFPDNEWYGSGIAVNKDAIIVVGSLLGITLYDIMAGISYDGGVNWVEISNGLPVPWWPTMRLVHTYDNRIFVSPRNQGLWYRDDLLVDIEKQYEETGLFKIYPNPVKEVATLEVDKLSNSNCYVNIYDINGLLVRQVSVLSSITKLELHDLNTGLFILQFIDGKKVVYKKFIKL